MCTEQSFGVVTPIFWGSLIGVIASTILGGIVYLEIPEPVYSVSNDPAGKNTWIIVVFCCLLCVRYYTAIIFHSYEATNSMIITNIGSGKKLIIFFSQIIIIMGCGLIIAVMPIYGTAGSALIILFQALTVLGGYWFIVGKTVLQGDGKDQYKISLVGDIVVIVAATAFAVYRIQESVADDNMVGVGMFFGMVILLFMIEIVTRYQRSMKIFLIETLKYLRT